MMLRLARFKMNFIICFSLVNLLLFLILIIGPYYCLEKVDTGFRLIRDSNNNKDITDTNNDKDIRAINNQNTNKYTNNNYKNTNSNSDKNIDKEIKDDKKFSKSDSDLADTNRTSVSK